MSIALAKAVVLHAFFVVFVCAFLVVFVCAPFVVFVRDVLVLLVSDTGSVVVGGEVGGDVGRGGVVGVGGNVGVGVDVTSSLICVIITLFLFQLFMEQMTNRSIVNRENCNNNSDQISRSSTKKSMVFREILKAVQY